MIELTHRTITADQLSDYVILFREKIKFTLMRKTEYLMTVVLCEVRGRTLEKQWILTFKSRAETVSVWRGIENG